MGWQTERETIQRETQRQRDRGASWNSDVVVPAGQALLIGAGAGIGALVVVAVLTAALGWRFWLPFAAAGVAGGMAFALAAVLLTLDHRRLLWAVEAALQVDLDDDQAIGEPEPEPVRVEIVSEDGRHRQYGRIPMTDEEIRNVGKAVMRQGVAFSRRKLDAAGALSPERYTEVKDALLKAGFIRLAGESEHAGLEVTPAGRSFFRAYLNGRQ